RRDDRLQGRWTDDGGDARERGQAADHEGDGASALVTAPLPVRRGPSARNNPAPRRFSWFSARVRPAETRPNGGTMRQGQLRPIHPVDEEEDSEQVDWPRLVSAWSLAILAVIAVAAAVYFAREPLIPVVTAFVVGVMLSPVARALEERKVPRLLTAALMVAGTALVVGVVGALIASPLADLAGRAPQIGAKLETFHGLMEWWRRLEHSIVIHPSAAEPAVPLPSVTWIPTTLGDLTPPVTGFVYFLVVLLLFISWWPGLRRDLVMTFASRDSRLTVLKILNEVEASLAAYLLTVTCINLCVGAAAGVIAFLTGLPFPLGF